MSESDCPVLTTICKTPSQRHTNECTLIPVSMGNIFPIKNVCLTLDMVTCFAFCEGKIKIKRIGEPVWSDG